MALYLGTRSWRCIDCGQTLHVPYDWHRPIRLQPTELRAGRYQMITAHARAMPLLHPTLLPEHHLLAARRGA